MPLIQCPECNHKVSTKAQACPSCGCPGNIIGREDADVIPGQAFDAHLTVRDSSIQKVKNKEFDFSFIKFVIGGFAMWVAASIVFSFWKWPSFLSIVFAIFGGIVTGFSSFIYLTGIIISCIIITFGSALLYLISH